MDLYHPQVCSSIELVVVRWYLDFQGRPSFNLIAFLVRYIVFFSNRRNELLNIYFDLNTLPTTCSPSSSSSFSWEKQDLQHQQKYTVEFVMLVDVTTLFGFFCLRFFFVFSSLEMNFNSMLTCEKRIFNKNMLWLTHIICYIERELNLNFEKSKTSLCDCQYRHMRIWNSFILAPLLCVWVKKLEMPFSPCHQFF